LLKVTRPPAVLRAKTIGRVQSRHVAVEALEIASSPAVWLPAYLLIADKVPKTKRVLLVLDEGACDRLWFNPEVDQLLPEAGPIICAADVRGIGALAPEFGPGAADYAAWHQEEENYAWGSLILGEPLVGQRVTDVLALVAALRRHPATAGRPIHVAALGKLTVPALFAAALEREIKGVYLAGGLVSFQNLVETEFYSHSFANFVPGLLNHTDLPEVAASLAPRRITLAGPVNAMGKTMEIDAARAIYRSAHDIGALSIYGTANWSAGHLISYVESQEAL
jgi:hypothetical protein